MQEKIKVEMSQHKARQFGAPVEPGQTNIKWKYLLIER